MGLRGLFACAGIGLLLATSVLATETDVRPAASKEAKDSTKAEPQPEPVTPAATCTPSAPAPSAKKPSTEADQAAEDLRFATLEDIFAAAGSLETRAVPQEQPAVSWEPLSEPESR